MKPHQDNEPFRAAIVDKNPKMDIPRIEKWVKQFADILEIPSIWDDIAEILK